MISLEQIRNTHNKIGEKVIGSISPKDAFFIQKGIIQCKPKKFIEIGTASGISTGFIGMFLQENGGEELITLDIAKRFYVDPSKQTGYLADLIIGDKQIDIRYIRGEYSTYIIRNLGKNQFNMAFIDANHQHPWPTLDMLSILPAMKKGALIYHHDLSLYKNPEWVDAIGPKFLFDQIPDNSRVIMNEPEGNTYYIKIEDEYTNFENALIDSIHIPWTLNKGISNTVLHDFISIAQDYWSEKLSNALLQAANKFNANEPEQIL